MRLLGIDFGTKRIGIAISDENAEFAIPTSVIKNTGDIDRVSKEILELINKNKIEEVVIGESKDFKGNDNPVMKECNKLKLKLENLNLKIHMEPEFLTSLQAEKIQGKNDMVDASAAALILQSFLDKSKIKNN